MAKTPQTIDLGASQKPTGTDNTLPPGQQTGKSRFDSGNYTPQKYNEIYHNVDLYLDNSGNFDNPKRYYINPAAVIGLHISDAVNDWVVDGSLTFLYLPGGTEEAQHVKAGAHAKTPTTGVIQAAADNGNVLNSYLFRGDGYDLLRVMIVPDSKEQDGASPDPVAPGMKIDQNSTEWTLSYLFSIYDVEDVKDIPDLQGPMSGYLKCLKLKFHDVRYQMLLTANLEYSSAEPKDKKFESNFSSEMAPGQGVLYTGQILKDIFNETLANTELGGCEEFRLEENDELKDEQGKKITLWDKGKAELFYTSPAQWSAADDVEYVSSQHVSEAELDGGFNATYNDMCLLHTDRSPYPGFLEPIRLTPLKEFFERAGATPDTPGTLQKEHFFITANTHETSVTDIYFAPRGGPNSNTIDLKTAKYGQILSYSFVDMSPAINSNMFCSTPVYSVDIGERQFNVEFKGNDVISARRMISNSYISRLFKEGKDNEKLFLPTIHKNKQDVNIFPTFTLNGNNPAIRQRCGLHHLLYTGVFQNACICFKALGLTLRSAGMFIGIDRTDGSEKNDYNNKLYGQWFVVKVDHMFESNGYVNIIYAVKIHRHDSQQTKFEGTIEQPK